MAKWPYNTGAWKSLRKIQLYEHPLCLYCEQAGRIVQADIVDHVQRVQDRPDLAFDMSNLSSLCKKCHDAIKQKQEKGSSFYASGCDENGFPLDVSHPWHKGGAS